MIAGILMIVFLVFSSHARAEVDEYFVFEVYNFIRRGALTDDFLSCPPLDARAMDEDKYEFIRTSDWGEVVGWKYYGNLINRPNLYIYISDAGVSMTLGVYVERGRCKVFEANWVVD